MSGAAYGRPAVFLDRDGTLIDEPGYLEDPDALRLFPGAARAVRALNDAGLAVVVVTNQSGVARGLFDLERLERVHARLCADLAAEGARLDLVLACPHHPELGLPPWRRACDCRKPEPGLLLEAARRLGLDLARSFVVGDAPRDLEAGRRAGVPQRVLVATGKGRESAAELGPAGLAGVLRARDLVEAAELVLARAGRGARAPDQGR